MEKKDSLKVVFQRFFTTCAFCTDWSQDIEIFLILLRMFPAKNKSADVFTEAIKKFIIFRMVRDNT